MICLGIHVTLSIWDTTLPEDVFFVLPENNQPGPLFMAITFVACHDFESISTNSFAVSITLGIIVRYKTFNENIVYFNLF